MANSSIEILEPRWAPARLVAGPLPSEFGVDLPVYHPESIQPLVIIELTKSEGPSFLLVQIATGWKPDPHTIAFATSELAPPSADLPEYILDRRAAYLAAHTELGETTGGGFSSPRRGGR